MDKTCVMCAFLVWGPDQILGGRIKDLRIRSGDSRSISVCLPGMCVYTNEMQLSSPPDKRSGPQTSAFPGLRKLLQKPKGS